MAWRRPTEQRGFTFVELIVVVSLLGILSMFALSRMGNTDAFAVENLNSSIIATARLAQQSALARRGDGIVLNLIRTAAGYELNVTATATAETLHLQSIDAPAVALELRAGVINHSLQVGEALSYDLDNLGNLVAIAIAGVPAAATDGIDFVITGEGSRELCVAASGFAHRGNCL